MYIKIRCNIITSQFKPISWQGKAKLFMSQCSSFYGCHLWNLDDKNINALYTAWHVSCRRVLGLNPRTRTYLLSHLLKTMTIENLIYNRISSFFLNGLQHTNGIIKSMNPHRFLPNPETRRDIQEYEETWRDME